MSTERGSASAGPLSAYLETLDPPVAALFGGIVARARDLAPGVEEGLGYGMPALRYRERPLLSVQQARDHLGYYPFSQAVVASAADGLAGFSFSKGTVRFSVDHPLPAAVVDRMILERRDEIDAALAR